jgi:hypothetical protein
MHIKYSKKRLNYNLIFGLIWLLIFVAYLFLKTNSFLKYGYLFIGILFLSTYFFEKTKHYLTIENGVITKNQLFPKRIQLDKIKDIRYFAGEYKLISDTSEIRILTQFIEKKSLEDLKTVIETLKQQIQ